MLRPPLPTTWAGAAHRHWFAFWKGSAASMAIGIASYGCYFPAARLSSAELRRVWAAAPAGLETKTVAALDEDALTLCIEAIAAAGSQPAELLSAIALGSTSLPYSQRVQAGLL